MKQASPPVIFLGPTLDHITAAPLAVADFKPPAAMGDITRAAAAQANLIVLVDGVFENGPSVWHKEILFAISEGIPVIGASSMGALRAAELHNYGMTGYGAIYNEFASGRLNDDDEVAVVHGPAELGWPRISDAMVDIRADVNHAASIGVLSAGEADAINAHAKASFFKERKLQTSLEVILPASRNQEQQSKIADWFRTRGPSLKERDCRALLENLPMISAVARSRIKFASKFVPTIYLKRLQEFGYSI